mgnify:CR=1 FL=1
MSIGTVRDPRLQAQSSVRYPYSDVTGANMSSIKATIREEVNKHTIFKVEHKGVFNYYKDTLRSGSPLTVSVQTGQNTSRTWYGYIDSVTPSGAQELNADNETSVGFSTEIIGVGLTYPLKSTSQQIWESTQLSDVVVSLVDATGLAAVCDDDNLRQTVPQSGRSGWQLITSLGAATGRITFTSGSTVNWLRPEAIFTQFQPNAARLTYSTSITEVSRNPFYLRSFDQITTDNTSHLDGSWSTKVSAAGVDPVSASVSVTESGEGMFARYLDATARSSDTVGVKAQGSAESSFPHRALTNGPGNTLVSAGYPVYITNGDSGNWWIVRSVTHHLDSFEQTYEMEIELMRRPDFPTNQPSTFPQVNMERRKATDFCLCQELTPELNVPFVGKVYGAGTWGTLPRWTAKKVCP